MTTFNIDSWVNDIKIAFISTLEESDVPMSYIEIAKKTGLKKHDDKNWFAMGIIGELYETKQVEKEMKNGKTKYKIPGREYTQMPEVLENLGCIVLKARLRALPGEKGVSRLTKPQLIKRLRDHEALTRKFLED